eukprot:scaffold21263_cov141-Isochrysis_galbana.AAC.3
MAELVFLACRPSLPCHGASWAEKVDLSRGSLEREKSCLKLSLQEGRRRSKKCLMCWVRLRFPEGLRSARSMAAVLRNVCEASFSDILCDAMQPSGCRGVQRWQAGCSRLQLRIALATEAAGLRALARRGCKLAARHLNEAIRMLW